jgi:hypothetical protein
MLNRAVMSKFGFRLGEVFISLRRDSAGFMRFLRQKWLKTRMNSA